MHVLIIMTLLYRHDRNRQGGGFLFFATRFFCTFPGSRVSWARVCYISVTSHCRSFLPSSYSAPVCIFDTLLNLSARWYVTFVQFYLVGDFNVNLCNSHCPLLPKLQSFASSLDPHSSRFWTNSLLILLCLTYWFSLAICRLLQIFSVVQSSLYWPILIIKASVFLLLQVLLVKLIQREPIWRYSLANFERACERLDNTDWDSLFASILICCEQAFGAFCPPDLIQFP